MVEKVHRINKTDLEIGAQVEKSEHPWASHATAKKIATDHLRENPSAYTKGNKGSAGREVVILNQNVRVIPPRKKKKVVAQPKEPSGPGWIPQNLRMWG